MSLKYRDQYYVDFVLRHLWHKVSRIYNHEGQKHGVTMSVGFILLNIEREGINSTQLGPKMGMEPTSLSRTLKSMENQGLIYRKTEKNDKRRVLIFLTELGVEKKKMAMKVVGRFNEVMKEALPNGGLQTFFEMAERMDKTIDKELGKI